MKVVNEDTILYRMVKGHEARKGRVKKSDADVDDVDVEEMAMLRFYPVEKSFDVIKFVHSEVGHVAAATQQQVCAMALNHKRFHEKVIMLRNHFAK